MNLEKNKMILAKEIEKLANTIPNYKKQNDAISKSGIDWHVDHSLKVILAVCESLKKSDPKEYKWTFNFLRNVVFITNRFPRGKAKAPKITSAKEKVDKDELLKQLEIVKKELSAIEKLPKNSNFKHFIFGVLNLKQTIKFLGLHTKHHLKITDEIISSQP
jgi:hypothetical protein